MMQPGDACFTSSWKHQSHHGARLFKELPEEQPEEEPKGDAQDVGRNGVGMRLFVKAFGNLTHREELDHVGPLSVAKGDFKPRLLMSAVSLDGAMPSNCRCRFGAGPGCRWLMPRPLSAKFFNTHADSGDATVHAPNRDSEGDDGDATGGPAPSKSCSCHVNVTLRPACRRRSVSQEGRHGTLHRQSKWGIA